MMKNEIFICFDLETTGLSCIFNKIIEIGAVMFSYSDGVIKTYQQLVNPECTILEQTTQINNITNDMVKDAPTIDAIIPDFLNFIGDKPCIAHNAYFDMSFISFNLKVLNIPLPRNKIFDTIALSRKMFPHIKKYGLTNLKKYFNITTGQAHRAIPDCLATMDLFNHCLKQWKCDKKNLNDLKKLVPPIRCKKIENKKLKRITTTLT